MGRFIAQHEDALFLGPPGTGKSHLAQAIGRAVIQQGYRVLDREAQNSRTPRSMAPAGSTSRISQAVPLLVIDDLGMRTLPHTAAEDLLEVIMRRYGRASTLLTSNRPVDDNAVSRMFGRIKATLERRGTRIEDFDAAIAAHALALAATLVTANLDHLIPVQGLRVEDWS